MPPGAAGRLAWGIFLVTLAGYLLTGSGHTTGQDQEYYYRMARALVLERSFAIEPLQVETEASRRGVDGRFYAIYAPGLPVVLAPFVLAGRSLGEVGAALGPHYVPYGFRPQDEGDLGARFVASYFNAPVTAATAALLALLVLRLGYPPAAAAFTALAFAFATPAWGQARVLSAEPLQGLLLVLAVVLLLRASSPRALAGGVVLALGMLVKLTTALALPVVLLLPDAHGRPLWRTPALAALVVLPALGALAVHGIYNLARYGNVLATGYVSPAGVAAGRRAGTGGAVLNPLRGLLGGGFAGNPLVGVFGLLLSPGRGILWYAPPAAAAVAVYRRFYAERPEVARMLIALGVPWLVVHASWIDWHGGWGWGPRFLLPILPLVLVPLAQCWLSPRARAPALGLALLGALVQLPGATVDFWVAGDQVRRTYLERCTNCTTPDFHAFHFLDPAASDLVVHTRLLLGGSLDVAWITYAGTWVTPLVLGLAAASAIAGLALLRQRPGRSAPTPHRFRGHRRTRRCR